MQRTLDFRSVFALDVHVPQYHLVPQTLTEFVLAFLFLLILYRLFRALKLVLLDSKLSESTALVSSPDDQFASKDLIRNHDSLPLPLPAHPSLVTSVLSYIGAMIISPIAARPVPVPEPPSAIVDRQVDVASKLIKPPLETPCPVKQPYDAFLVLDVEATCLEGTDFNWPNEIIEWPVILLRWRNKDKEGRAKELYIVDEFRSFVKPTWKPELSAFCTSLTGITQMQVDRAPKFTKVLESCREFLLRNGLIDPFTGDKLERFVWCTDGPFDIRDFVVKQCFISKVQMPLWLKGDVLDVRQVVRRMFVPRIPFPKNGVPAPKRRVLNIEEQLRALDLAEFIGRQHSGIDDTRNIARILIELAKRGVRLEPNTMIYPGRRWQWMGKPGQILEEYCFI